MHRTSPHPNGRSIAGQERPPRPVLLLTRCTDPRLHDLVGGVSGAIALGRGEAIDPADATPVPATGRLCPEDEPPAMGATEGRPGTPAAASGEVSPGEPSQPIAGPRRLPQAAPVGDLSGVRVLFVDDDDLVRTMVAAMLRRLLATATVVSSPLEALRLVREDVDRFDVLVTDLTMPKMTGHQLFLQVRELAPALPVMIISGDPLDAKIQACLDQGARGFLPKPFTMARFAQAVHDAYNSGSLPS